jgi:hypothetical protein
MKHLPLEIQPETNLSFFIKTYGMVQLSIGFRMEKYRNQ